MKEEMKCNQCGKIIMGQYKSLEVSDGELLIRGFCLCSEECLSEKLKTLGDDDTKLEENTVYSIRTI